MANIVVVGSLNYDITVRVTKPPRPGETVLAEEAALGPGGKGANQAVAAARLGATVTMVGRVGDDPLGRALVQSLRAEGVGTGGVRVSTRPTGVAVITLDESGENSIVVAAGANHDTVVLPDLSAAAAVLVQGEIRPEVTAAALGAGGFTVLNTAPATDEVVALAPRAGVVVANQEEAKRLPGLTGLTVITLGARGAVAERGKDRWETSAPTVDVVDTVGAGDAFCAALTVALAEERDVPGALRFAVAAGALAVTRPGAAAAMPSRDEVDALVARGWDR